MSTSQTHLQPLCESEVGNRAYQLWAHIETLSSWLIDHYWNEICDGLEASETMDEWPPVLNSDSPSATQ